MIGELMPVTADSQLYLRRQTDDRWYDNIAKGQGRNRLPRNYPIGRRLVSMIDLTSSRSIPSPIVVEMLWTNPIVVVMLCAVVWATMCTRLVAQQVDSIPPPEPYIESSGTVRGLELLPGEPKAVGGIDFCFHFKPDGDDREWLVISRGSTPFEISFSSLSTNVRALSDPKRCVSSL